MNTILVVYSDKKSLSKTDKLRMKKYSFNTKDKLKEDDVISSESYDTNMHVVKVLPQAFKYFNSATGELSDTFNSTSQWEIRELVIHPKDENKVYANLVE